MQSKFFNAGQRQWYSPKTSNKIARPSKPFSASTVFILRIIDGKSITHWKIIFPESPVIYYVGWYVLHFGTLDDFIVYE